MRHYADRRSAWRAPLSSHLAFGSLGVVLLLGGCHAPQVGHGASALIGDPDGGEAPPDFTWIPPDMAWTPPDMAWTPPDMAWTPPDFTWTPPDMAWTPPDFTWIPPDMAWTPPDFTWVPPDLSPPPPDICIGVCTCPATTVEILDGWWRTIDFAVFPTIAPQVRITLSPAVDPLPGQYQVLIDDGEDASDDQLDITQFFTFAGGVATAALPETVPLNSLPGNNQSLYRTLFTDPTVTRLVYYGENRLRFVVAGQPCHSGNFLGYTEDQPIVVGINDGVEPLPGHPYARIMTNHIDLNFLPGTSDAQISTFLGQHGLRPQGIIHDYEQVQVQVRDLSPLSGPALMARIAQLEGLMGYSEGAYPDYAVVEDPATAGERQPAAVSADLQANGAWSANGRRSQHNHFAIQTFPAHRLIDLTKDGGATVRIYMPGSGVANGANFSGPAANLLNRYFVRGNRIFQATDIRERGLLAALLFGRTAVASPSDDGNPAVGDLTNVTDTVPHDTAVMAIMAGDGVGDQLGGMNRNINQIILGTGKDAQVRVVRWEFEIPYFAYVKQLRISALDPNTRIHLIERSFGTHTTPHLIVRLVLAFFYSRVSDAGKLIVGAAWNEGAAVAGADAGFIAPSNNTSRKDLAGPNAFRKNVMVIGASGRVLAANTLETRAGYSNFGPEISVVAPDRPLCIDAAGSTVDGLGAQHFWSGTSFTTPQVAGIAAELMLVDPTLQLAANITKVAQFIEATADDIDAAGVDNNVGFGRVNFWKSVLSAANAGLSSEGRVAQGDGTDNFFKDLPLKNEAATTWYGFEVRTGLQNTVLWFRNNLGQYAKVQDAGQTRPAIAGANAADVLTYMSTQPHRDAGSRILPSLPLTPAELMAAPIKQRFLARFSIPRADLVGQTALLALPLGKTPQADPHTVLFELPLTDRTDLRRAQGANGANAARIRSLVKEFNNFVFHIDYDPVKQVRARLPNQAFKVGQKIAVNLELKNVGANAIPVGSWIISGWGNVLAFDNEADFAPPALAAGATLNVAINMTCIAAGNVTLHADVLRTVNAADQPVIVTALGVGANDSQDGTMTCTP